MTAAHRAYEELMTVKPSSRRSSSNGLRSSTRLEPAAGGGLAAVTASQKSARADVAEDLEPVMARGPTMFELEYFRKIAPTKRRRRPRKIRSGRCLSTSRRWVDSMFGAPCAVRDRFSCSRSG